MFNKFYWELSQKTKLPDSGESTSKQEKLLEGCALLAFREFYQFLLKKKKKDSHVACFCSSPWENLRAAGGPCRGPPQRHGQQLGQAVQSLPGRVKRTGTLM